MKFETRFSFCPIILTDAKTKKRTETQKKLNTKKSLEYTTHFHYKNGDDLMPGSENII